jgi:phosphoglycolate phosphatase-like HAD superfamily hydrolase
MIVAKAVIFDLDCTLVDTLERFFEVFRDLLKGYGKSLHWNEFFKRYVDDTLDEIVASLGDDRDKMLREFWLEFLRRYREDDPKGNLIPGVKEVLKGLHEADVPIAVITSCVVPTGKLRKELDEFNIGRFVKTLVTGHDVIEELEKSHHFSKVEIFELAVRKLGVDPRDCVIVGDYWNDIRDGKKVGAKTVAVLTGLMRRELLESHEPNAIVESVRELSGVVKFETGGG